MPHRILTFNKRLTLDKQLHIHLYFVAPQNSPNLSSSGSSGFFDEDLPPTPASRREYLDTVLYGNAYSASSKSNMD